MSTYIYLLCRDHSPAIRADGESGQHLSDLPQEPRPHEFGPASGHLMAQLTTWPRRFREKFTITEGCWVWTACRDGDGYGRFGMGRKDRYGVRRCRSCRDERERRRIRSRGLQGGRASDDA